MVSMFQSTRKILMKMESLNINFIDWRVINMDDYMNKIKWLKEIGQKSMSETNITLKDYAEILNHMFDQYGEEKVKKDLEIK